MTSKRRMSLFERLKQGLEEGIADAKGELTLRTVSIPNEPPEMNAKTVAALRTRAAMSQSVFAKMLSVSTKTNPELGTRRSPTLRCLTPIDSSLLRRSRRCLPQCGFAGS